MAITAPRLAIREPAIDTATIQVRTQGGWLIFNQKDKAEALRRNLTAHAREHAAQYIDPQLVELCRQSLRNFLSSWLRRSGETRPITSIEFAGQAKERT